MHTEEEDHLQMEQWLQMKYSPLRVYFRALEGLSDWASRWEGRGPVRMKRHSWQDEPIWLSLSGRGTTVPTQRDGWVGWEGGELLLRTQGNEKGVRIGRVMVAVIHKILAFQDGWDQVRTWFCKILSLSVYPCRCIATRPLAWFSNRVNFEH